MASASEMEVFLNDSEMFVEPFSAREAGVLSDHPLQVLKALVLSIDWEISEDTVSGFLLELGRLQKTHADDPVNRKWFELLVGIGNYILKRKADIHPEAIRLLHAVFQDMEASFYPDRTPAAQRKERLLSRISEYNRLRDMVRSAGSGERLDQAAGIQRPLSEDRPKQQPLSAPPAANGSGEDASPEAAAGRTDSVPRDAALHDAFVEAMTELRNLIQAEFRALRAEIRLWRAEGQ
ncbi:hypothetical protein [Desulfatirhabdium butyrativorans]|uniref:hypothetical protein n=1 Tax=Desulfatirhabdium butyrativorans TaxID=340467 RepID=UPI0004031C72|nr:hypothetical protein [Desulfatirhabdium butyrativorans]